ncbi:putative Phosphohistidine phosphatase SixA [Crocosphaera subtropica ATCC 51142]|uniref:Phosphohistidine phosphatase SixA n=1 Tax=Crocosphaera subtropica (strain ATCC 51142 / BH68) TaxID=43989 RepID=B1WX85_CROS5|nr:phosphohistidine phosphatase SixA [Crocosphaera subtropica]ACB50829.1 putative Phosphohistidine phosphatase SixA [Crocosphaera subtropica ATCC 51142]
MTQLYLIRHGIAVERNNSIQDEVRPLTELGKEKTQKVAQRLKEVKIKFDIILTSPLLRAHQTATILQNAGLTDRLEEFIPLSPGGSLQLWVDWWLNSHYHHDQSTIALVGHQPDLSNWAEIFLWGDTQGILVVKKAGIIGLNLPTSINPIGESELFLLTPPKFFI